MVEYLCKVGQPCMQYHAGSPWSYDILFHYELYYNYKLLQALQIPFAGLGLDQFKKFDPKVSMVFFLH